LKKIIENIVLFDFCLQAITLLTYVIISPFLFDLFYPTTGDVSLIWIWVIVVTGITSIASLIIFVLLNIFVSPEKTYKFKGITPLLISLILMYNIGSYPNKNMEVSFLLENIILIVSLYFINGFMFFKRIKSNTNKMN